MTQADHLPIRPPSQNVRRKSRKPSAWPLFLLIFAAFGSGVFLERYGLSGTPWGGIEATSFDVPASSLHARTPSDLEKTEERVKQLQTEVQKRAAYLASLVEDVKRLNRGNISSHSEKLLKSPLPGERRAIGGGKSGGHAFYRFSDSSTGTGSKLASRDDKANTVVELSPLLEIDANLADFVATPIGAPVPGDVTSGFGMRESPFEGGRQHHQGIDFAVDEFTSVLATADGVVTTAGRMSGYGKTVIIRHKSGVETLYAHLSRINVKLGDRICRGQKLGLVGMTGQTTGPHLHYEVRLNGIARNPERFVQLGALISELAELVSVG